MPWPLAKMTTVGNLVEVQQQQQQGGQRQQRQHVTQGKKSMSSEHLYR
jgi:hypothetical protein